MANRNHRLESDPANDPFSRWSLSIRNGAGLAITDVQFPFVVVGYRLDGKAASEALLRPLNAGQLLRAPKPKDFEPDTPYAWQFRPENHDTWHYPGLTFAQFLAYCNDAQPPRGPFQQSVAQLPMRTTARRPSKNAAVEEPGRKPRLRASTLRTITERAGYTRKQAAPA